MPSSAPASTYDNATLMLAASRLTRIETLARMACKHAERRRRPDTEFGVRQISFQLAQLCQELGIPFDPDEPSS